MALIETVAAEPSAAADARERLVVVNIEDGAVAPNKRRVQVTQGDHVRLRITTDRKVVLHLHGYDIEKTIRPHVVTELSFDATAAGRFPVFVHSGAGGGHGHSHHAPLIELEVRPR